MSHVSGGLVYKRIMNSLRKGGSAPAVDPFWNDVICLCPFDGAGILCQDYSNNHFIPTYNVPVGPTASIFAETATNQLFGKNTLQYSKVAFDASLGAVIHAGVQNIYSAVSPICFEYFVRYDFIKAGTSCSEIGDWSRPFWKRGNGNLFELKFYLSTVNYNMPGFALNTWYYVCQQYDNTDGIARVFVGDVASGFANLIHSFAPQFDGNRNLFFYIGHSGTSTSGIAFEQFLANFRYTRALRYPGLGPIPIPTAPFPTSGP